MFILKLEWIIYWLINLLFIAASDSAVAIIKIGEFELLISCIVVFIKLAAMFDRDPVEAYYYYFLLVRQTE